MAQKQWTLTILSPPTGPLAVLRDGAPLPAEIGPGQTTPVELLLVSVGTCFALSCHAAFVGRKLPRAGLEVRVTGRKHALPPSRLEHVTLEVVFDDSLATTDQEAVAALAKQLCTVTNTLTSEPGCSIEIRVPEAPA